MPPSDKTLPLQSLALRDFTALSVLSPSWGGRLVLSLGLDEAGMALSIATHIAGGVLLAIEDDAARLREVTRNGAVDFVVTTLDEALRAIKNELRKGTPLSVALRAHPGEALEEALERGLAPQLFARFAGAGSEELIKRAAAQFSSLDAELVDFEGAAGSTASGSYRADKAEDLMAAMVAGEDWALSTIQAETMSQLRDLDTAVMSLLPPHDRLRRRWLENVARVMQRQTPPSRSLWLTPAERNRLQQEGYCCSASDE